MVHDSWFIRAESLLEKTSMEKQEKRIQELTAQIRLAINSVGFLPKKGELLTAWSRAMQLRDSGKGGGDSADQLRSRRGLDGCEDCRIRAESGKKRDGAR